MFHVCTFIRYLMIAYSYCLSRQRGGLMVSVLVPRSSGPGSSPAEDTVLYSWARHLILTVPLSSKGCKWVLVNCWGNLTNCKGVTCDGLPSLPGGVEIFLAASYYRNRDKLQKLHVWAKRLQGFTSRQLPNFTLVFYIDFCSFQNSIIRWRSKYDNFNFHSNICNLILLVSSQRYVT